jgi:hypothetical protein
MNMSTTSQIAGTAPCDCANLGVRAVSGSVDCATCLNEGYSRPRFFAGQLLTEDDLQQLTNYVMAKNRLHARYLAGSGVVCGLEVVCHPCGGGTVIVNPGYALDCCGNDIVLACPQTLDINRMVRELQLKLRGGFDCGDPCAESQGSGTGYGHGTSYRGANQSGKEEAPASGGHTAQASYPERAYCLYINYCEQPTDPVAPYATDSPCGQLTCEPTRVREGFQFELRCPESEKPYPAFCTQFWDCIGDLTALERTIKDSGHLQSYGRQVREALKTIHANPDLKIANRQAYLATLQTETDLLNRVLSQAKNQMAAEHAEAQLPSRAVLDAILNLARHMALFRVQPDEVQQSLRQVRPGERPAGTSEEAATTPPSRGAIIDDAETALISIYGPYSPLISALISGAAPTALEQAYVSSLLQLVRKIAPEEQPGASPASREGVTREGNATGARPVPLTQTWSVRLLAAGGVLTPELQSAAVDSLTALRDWILNRLEQSERRTRCDLPEEVKKVSLPPKSSRADVDASDASAFGESSKVLARIVQELLRSCFCSALNPPCTACDDPGVLLACLRVQDCRVKSICNLARDFVISPVALRYWIPGIQRMGEAIEKWCCTPVHADESSEAESREEDLLSRGMGRVPGSVCLVLSMLSAACPEPGTIRGDFGDELLGHLARSVRGRLQPAAAAQAKPVTFAEDVSRADAEGDREPARGANADLEEMLRQTRSELESVIKDQQKLLDRISDLEKSKKKPPQA